MLVVCLSLLLCAISASGHQTQLEQLRRVLSKTLPTEFITFRNVFGDLRMQTHFPTLNSFLRATASSQSGEQLYLACSGYDDGVVTKKFLEEFFATGNVDTVYLSAGQDSACFLVHGVDSSATHIGSPFANSVMEAHSLTVWEPVPSVLKIHPSTLQQMGISADTSRNTNTLHNNLPSSRHASHFPEDNLHEMKLMVSRKLATIGKKVDVKSRKLSAEKYFYHTNKEITDSLDIFSSHYADEAFNIWSSALHLTSNENGNVCTFSNLEVRQEGSNIAVSQLHRLHEPPLNDNLRGVSSESQDPFPSQQETCFVQLLAILASDSSTIDIRFRRVKRAFNRYGKGIIQTNSYNDTVPYTVAGLDGSGQVIGIGDSGLDEMSCYFRNDDGLPVTRSDYFDPVYNMSKRKVIQYIDYADNADLPSGHGTHVCGTLAGLNIEESDLYDGHASGSKIAFFDMENSAQPENGLSYPSPIENFFEPSRLAGANIHSNSWGGPVNFYDADTVAVDKYMYDNENFLIVFAAGNDGDHGYYSVGDPACSKNALTVGASLNSINYEDVVYFSSLGPTFDNRIKPDVVAPGAYIFSARSSDTESCATTGKAGTSMAAPGVAGVASQVRQYFEEPSFWATACANSGADFIRNSDTCVDGAFSPLGSTVKAIIIHSGESMTRYFGDEETKEPMTDLNGTPDNYQGFGRVALPNVLPLAGVDTTVQLYVDEIFMFSNSEIVIRLQVSDNSRPLKATIAWMDPDQSSIAQKVLLHDIDLRIVRDDGDNTTWHGNRIAGDEVNTVEQVLIESPSVTSDYYIYVTSKVITENIFQKVSLVITGAGLTQVSRVVNVAPSRYPRNELQCADDEMMITARLMDRGGDGWESGDFLMITNHLAEVVSTTTMTSTVPYDLIKVESFCLPVGRYELTLLTLGDDFEEMSVSVDECATYLAGSIPAHHSAAVDVASDGNGEFTCNLCSGATVPLLLVGSLYGFSYGWVDGVTYRVIDSRSSIVIEGTLATGIFEERQLCLADGEYTLSFYVPADAEDDYFDDDASGNVYGMEEYRIMLNNNDIINVDAGISFSVVNGAMSNQTSVYEVNHAAGDDDDAVAELVIIIVVSIIVVIILILFCLCAMGVLYCGREQPLTREEVEAKYRADIAELMRVENPLQMGNSPGEEIKAPTPAKPIKVGLGKRLSARMSRRFSNFDTPDWRTKLEASTKEVELHDISKIAEGDKLPEVESPQPIEEDEKETDTNGKIQNLTNESDILQLSENDITKTFDNFHDKVTEDDDVDTSKNVEVGGAETT